MRLRIAEVIAMSKTLNRIAIYMAVGSIAYMMILALAMLTLLVIKAFNGA